MFTRDKIITASLSDFLLAEKVKQPKHVSYTCGESHEIRVMVSHDRAPFIAANAHPWRNVVQKYPCLAAIEFNEGQWSFSWDGNDWICDERHAADSHINRAAA
jgi:hypothetical protein